MTTDRELLELAAKAAGYSLDGLASAHVAQGVGPDDLLRRNEQGGHSVWNPLTYNGDTLCLAALLEIDCEFTKTAAGARDFCYVEPHDGSTSSKLKAVRRAIVRAAAAIGAP